MKNRKNDIKVINGTYFDRIMGSIEYLELDGVKYQHAEHWYLGDIFKEILIGDNIGESRYMYLPSPQSNIYGIDTVHQIECNGIKMLIITFTKNPGYYEELGGKNLLNRALKLAYDNIKGKQYYITDYRFGIDEYINWFVKGYLIVGDALADIAYKNNILINIAFHNIVSADKPITYENIDDEVYRQWRIIRKNPKNTVDLFDNSIITRTVKTSE